MKRVTYTIDQDRRGTVLARLKTKLEQEDSVSFAYVYGSLLESETVHDVDVGIYLRESHMRDGVAIATALSVSFTATVGLPVDVRILNEPPLSFLYHVLRGRVVLCRDEPLLTAMIEDVARRYLDLAPLLRQSTKDAFAA